MYAIHEASLQSHELYCDDPIRSSSTSIEIRNYLVANPIYINNELYETFLEIFSSLQTRCSKKRKNPWILRVETWIGEKNRITYLLQSF